jgi:hypothetical protein
VTTAQLNKLGIEGIKKAHELITPVGLEELAYVYGIGALKYAPNAWRENRVPIEKLYGRVLGHTRRRLEGETYDKDDFQMHMASVAWAALAICHYDKEDGRA